MVEYGSKPPEPITLELRGNAQPDLACCLLTFVIALRRLVIRTSIYLLRFNARIAGDVTAARKVRMLPPSLDRADAIRKARTISGASCYFALSRMV